MFNARKNTHEIVAQFFFSSRSAVFGFQLGVGKLAGIAATVTFGELLASNCYVPMFLVAILLTTGGLAVLGLSRSSTQELH